MFHFYVAHLRMGLPEVIASDYTEGESAVDIGLEQQQIRRC
jgi:hypothetical protein